MLAFAGEADPIDAIRERARATVLDAVDKGWEGPPFDPFELAGLLGVGVVPHPGLEDARVLPSPPRIEYNPTRPRGRLRFSVAHELAHLFFPDADKAIRYRSGHRVWGSDDWQLELLCNIAAGELLMPTSSLGEVAQEHLDINTLMQLRKSFDVSTEALLLRVAKETVQPVAVFAAARLDGASSESAFRLDYVVGSRSWSAPISRGMTIPNDSVLAECTAVGFTAKSRESWGGLELDVQAVGAPPYPGDQLPRILGLLLVPGQTESSVATINHVYGDATEPRGEGPKIVAHVVNDRARSWGGPFARALGNRYPTAQKEFSEWARADSSGQELGLVHWFSVAPELHIASMVAQKGYGSSVKPRIRYPSLLQCLQEVGERAKELGATAHMPRIGAGQGRGHWPLIEELIDDALTRQGIPVHVYTLPDEEFPTESTPLESSPAQESLPLGL